MRKITYLIFTILIFVFGCHNQHDPTNDYLEQKYQFLGKDGNQLDNERSESNVQGNSLAKWHESYGEVYPGFYGWPLSKREVFSKSTFLERITSPNEPDILKVRHSFGNPAALFGGPSYIVSFYEIPVISEKEKLQMRYWCELWLLKDHNPTKFSDPNQDYSYADLPDPNHLTLKQKQMVNLVHCLTNKGNCLWMFDIKLDEIELARRKQTENPSFLQILGSAFRAAGGSMAGNQTRRQAYDPEQEMRNMQQWQHQQEANWHYFQESYERTRRQSQENLERYRQGP